MSLDEGATSRRIDSWSCGGDDGHHIDGVSFGGAIFFPQKITLFPSEKG